MEQHIRELQRRFETSGLLEDEIAYLRALHQTNRLSESQLEQAAYFGSDAANTIAPYTTPYDIAVMMARIPVMTGTFNLDDPPPAPAQGPVKMVDPPETSWFCDGIYKRQDRRDITDIWSQVDMIGFDGDLDEAGFETGLVTALLVLYWACRKNLAEQTWWHPTTRAYRRLRDAMITGEPVSDLPAVGYARVFINYLVDLVNLFNGHEDTEVESQEIVFNLQRIMSFYLDAIDIHQRMMCDFIADRMRNYLLGYATIEETLPSL